MGMTAPIVIICFKWIGDVVRAHGLVRLLHEAHPDAPIDLVTTAAAAPLVRFMPHVRQALVAEIGAGLFDVAQHRRLAGVLRAGGYGAAYVLPGTLKSALAPWLARIPERIGWRGEQRQLVLTRALRGERAIASMNGRFAGLAGATALPAPQLRVPEAQAAAFAATHALPPGLVVLAPGCNGAARRWPVEHVLALGQALLADGVAVAVTGGPAEAEVARALPGALDHTMRPLDDAALLMARAAAVVANDSGLLHVATALGVPSIGLFGPSAPDITGPVGEALLPLSEPVPCRPCFKIQRECPLGHHACLRDLAPARVREALLRVSRG
jgi:heptosyltransferase II